MQGNGAIIQFDPQALEPLIRQVVEATRREERSAADRMGGVLDKAPTSAASPLALRPKQAAKALGISPRLLSDLTKDGVVPCVRVGSGKRKTPLYPVALLQDWLNREAAKKEELKPNKDTGH
jgi:hypothetical protein